MCPERSHQVASVSAAIFFCLSSRLICKSHSLRCLHRTSQSICLKFGNPPPPHPSPRLVVASLAPLGKKNKHVEAPGANHILPASYMNSSVRILCSRSSSIFRSTHKVYFCWVSNVPSPSRFKKKTGRRGLMFAHPHAQAGHQWLRAGRPASPGSPGSRRPSPKTYPDMAEAAGMCQAVGKLSKAVQVAKSNCWLSESFNSIPQYSSAIPKSRIIVSSLACGLILHALLDKLNKCSWEGISHVFIGPHKHVTLGLFIQMEQIGTTFPQPG